MAQTGIKCRAYPTDEQRLVLSQWMGCGRVIYNAKCEEDFYFYKFSRSDPALADLRPKIDQAYSHFKSKELTPWLYEVPSQILRNASYRWYEAYQRFFKGLAERPKKKGKHSRESVWLTSELFHFEGNKLIIGTKKHPLGELSFKAHRPYKLPNSITISKHAKDMVCFLFL